MNRLFVLSFVNEGDQPIRNIKTYENIKKIVTGQGDNCTTGSSLNYPYFRGNYKLIAIDVSKQQALYADPKAIQQINFTENLDRAEGAWIVFIFEEIKESILDFLQEAVRVL